MAKIIDALKALFTKSSSVTSSSFIPVTNSSGEVTGQASISDMASVLGVNKMMFGEGTPLISSGTDLDDITRGAHKCQNATTAATLAHTPISASGFALWCIGYAESYVIQIVFGITKIYVRKGNNGVYGEWKEWISL